MEPDTADASAPADPNTSAAAPDAVNDGTAGAPITDPNAAGDPDADPVLPDEPQEDPAADAPALDGAVQDYIDGRVGPLATTVDGILERLTKLEIWSKRLHLG